MLGRFRCMYLVRFLCMYLIWIVGSIVDKWVKDVLFKEYYLKNWIWVGRLGESFVLYYISNFVIVGLCVKNKWSLKNKFERYFNEY